GQTPTRSALRRDRLAASRPTSDLRVGDGPAGRCAPCRRQDSQSPVWDDLGGCRCLPTPRVHRRTSGRSRSMGEPCERAFGRNTPRPTKNRSLTASPRSVTILRVYLIRIRMLGSPGSASTVAFGTPPTAVIPSSVHALSLRPESDSRPGARVGYGRQRQKIGIGLLALILSEQRTIEA